MPEIFLNKFFNQLNLKKSVFYLILKARIAVQQRPVDEFEEREIIVLQCGNESAVYVGTVQIDDQIGEERQQMSAFVENFCVCV